MGGKAVTSQRMSNDLYEIFRDHATEVLAGLHTDSEWVYPVRAFGAKQDHGDLDVLFMKTNDTKEDEQRPHKVKQALLNNHTDLDVVEHHSNGDILSMAVMFEGVPCQLDVIFTHKKHWQCAKSFYDYNDMGNLMGKVARWYHLKWGFQGLRYVVYSNDGSRKLDEVTLTRNPKEAFEFLGFDWNRYKKGFHNRHEVWDFVLNGTKTEPVCFLPKNLNAGQRHRDTKRTGYQLFMEYLNDQVNVDHDAYRPSHEETLKQVDEYFQMNVQKTVYGLREQDEMLQRAADKFNGHVVLNHFDDLEGGPQFGSMMKQWNSIFPTDVAKADFYLQNSRTVLLKLFKETFEL